MGIKKLCGVLCLVSGLLSAACGLALAADWLNAGGDASRSGWQKRERFFKPDNIKDLKLLWKRRLDGASKSANEQSALTPPIMLGPVITHRGIKELVFIASASNTINAVDADLGRVFWTRQIDAAPSPSCGHGLTAAPAMEPERNPRPASAEEDPDYRTTLRPLYALASDGLLHTLLPATGDDVRPALRFVPAGANATDLVFHNGVVETTTPGGCGGAARSGWQIDVKTGAVTQTSVRPPEKNAAWTASDGKQWSYIASANGIAAMHDGREAWRSRPMTAPPQPAVVNGIVFVLDAGAAAAHATMYALDAITGKELYSSGNQIDGSVESSGLAVANGHVTFADSTRTLYCFGFPIEIY